MTTETVQTAGFDIVPLARLAQGGRWRVEAMRSYSRPVLIWFTKGQGRVTVSGVRRGYGAHNAVFIPAGVMHGFDMLGQVMGNVVFFPNDPQSGLPDEPVHLRVRDAKRQSELSSLIDQMQGEVARSDASSPRAMSLLAGLIGVWMARQDELRDPDITEMGAGNRIAAAYASLLERDFRAPKSVASYASELGVTPTHLTRVCKHTMGKSASNFRDERIQTEARRMLRTTSMPVNQIASALGFTSAAYFTRAFVKSSGRTPTQFRKQGGDIPA